MRHICAILRIDRKYDVLLQIARQYFTRCKCRVSGCASAYRSVSSSVGGPFTISTWRHRLNNLLEHHRRNYRDACATDNCTGKRQHAIDAQPWPEPEIVGAAPLLRWMIWQRVVQREPIDFVPYRKNGFAMNYLCLRLIRCHVSFLMRFHMSTARQLPAYHCAWHWAQCGFPTHYSCCRYLRCPVFNFWSSPNRVT